MIPFPILNFTLKSSFLRNAGAWSCVLSLIASSTFPTFSNAGFEHVTGPFEVSDAQKTSYKERYLGIIAKTIPGSTDKAAQAIEQLEFGNKAEYLDFQAQLRALTYLVRAKEELELQSAPAVAVTVEAPASAAVEPTGPAPSTADTVATGTNVHDEVGTTSELAGATAPQDTQKNVAAIFKRAEALARADIESLTVGGKEFQRRALELLGYSVAVTAGTVISGAALWLGIYAKNNVITHTDSTGATHIDNAAMVGWEAAGFGVGVPLLTVPVVGIPALVIMILQFRERESACQIQRMTTLAETSSCISIIKDAQRAYAEGFRLLYGNVPLWAEIIDALLATPAAQQRL